MPRPRLGRRAPRRRTDGRVGICLRTNCLLTSLTSWRETGLVTADGRGAPRARTGWISVLEAPERWCSFDSRTCPVVVRVPRASRRGSRCPGGLAGSPPTPTSPFLSRASVYLSPISLRCTDDISASGERAVRVGEPLGLHMPALLPLRGWPVGCHAAISAP